MQSNSDPQYEGTPPELLPTSGVATERAEYESVYITEIPPTQDLRELTGPVDLGDTTAELYTKPATGVIVTTEQEWIPRGVALGRLLHSVSLAPGESTRIAVVDWDRRTGAITDETTTQAERLDTTPAQDRNVFESIKSAVDEEQSGKSKMSSFGFSASRGTSAGVPGLGASQSMGLNFGRTKSVSRSSGSRKIDAKTAQRIRNRTQQVATSLRDRRATAVRETFEGERSEATTRVVTNYNHMHALTIQYWEVVQGYLLRTRTRKCERCLFVPMKVLTFTDALARRYLAVLAAVAPPSWEARLAAIDPFAVGVSRTQPNSTGDLAKMVMGGPNAPLLKHFATTSDDKFWGVSKERAEIRMWNEANETWDTCDERHEVLAKDNRNYRLKKGTHSLQGKGTGRKNRNWIDAPCEAGEYEVGNARYGLEDGRPYKFRDVKGKPLSQAPPQSSAQKLMVWWDDEGIAGVELVGPDLVDTKVGEPGGDERTVVEFAEDDKLESIVLVNEQTPWGRELRRIEITARNKQPVVIGPEPEKPDSVRLDVRDAELCGVYGQVAGKPRRVVSLGFQVRGTGMAEDVIDHLNDNALYYSRAIWANADELTLSRILATYTYKGVVGELNVPLGAVLDPEPVAMTGNYLAFRWHFEDDKARETWLQENELAEGELAAPSVRIPLPTEGVFAEAVLGRSFAAEKVDLTRFWEWDQHPIPILPPDIKAAHTGSRAGDVAADTGSLEAAAAMIQKLAKLPEPTGLGPALQAVTAANVFRDMSGLDEAGGVLKASIEQAAKSEGAAADAETEAMRVASEHVQKISEQALEALPAILPLLGGPAGVAAAAAGGFDASKLGGLLNLVRGADSKAPEEAK